MAENVTVKQFCGGFFKAAQTAKLSAPRNVSLVVIGLMPGAWEYSH